MKVGEVWMFRDDGCIVKITKIWLDDPNDDEKMVSVKPFPYNVEDDDFADYYLDEFVRDFERVYNYKKPA